MTQDNPPVALVPVRSSSAGPSGLDIPPASDHAHRANPLRAVHQLLRGRYKWAIPLALILAVVGGYLGYISRQPEYRSTGLIRLKANLPRILYSTEQSNVMPMFDAFADAQVTLLTSQRAIEMAMQSPEWKALGTKPSNRALEDFFQRLSVQRGRGSELIQVSYTDPDPHVSMVCVKAVVDAYKKLYSDSDAAGDAERTQILEERRSNLANDLKGLNAQIQALGNERGSVDLQSTYEFMQQENRKIESELRQVQLQLTLADAAHGAATQPAATAPSVTVRLTAEELARTDPTMREYLQKRQELQSRIAELEVHFGEQHPQVKELLRSLDLLNATIAKYVASAQPENDGILPATPNGQLTTVAKLQAREKALQDMLEKSTASLTELGRKNLKIQDLQEQVRSVQQRLDETKARIEQLNVESAVSGRISVISNGEQPFAPFSDKRRQTAFLGSFAGLAMGLGVFILRGLMDQRVKDVGDARYTFRHTQKILGILPTLPEDLDDPEQAAVAAYCVHQIRTLLEIGAAPGPFHVWSTTSSSPGDGKTSLTLALGLSFAASGSRTLLVDCDLIGGGLTHRMNAIIRRKIGRILRQQGLLSEEQLHLALSQAQASGRRLGEVLIELGYLSEAALTVALAEQKETAVGLLDVLDGESLADCVGDTGTTGLSILPLGAAGAHHSGQLSPRAIRRVLDEAREKFDVVLIDTGPILGSLEAAIVAAAADGVILMTSRGQSRSLAARATAQLESIGAHIAGVVFNRAQPDDLASTDFSVSASVRSVRIAVGSVPGVRAAGARMGPVAAAVVSSATASSNGHGEPNGG